MAAKAITAKDIPDLTELINQTKPQIEQLAVDLGIDTTGKIKNEIIQLIMEFKYAGDAGTKTAPATTRAGEAIELRKLELAHEKEQEDKKLALEEKRLAQEQAIRLEEITLAREKLDKEDKEKDRKEKQEKDE